MAIILSGEVFTRDFVPLGSLDKVRSMQWISHWCSPGSFELWVPIDDDAKRLYKPGNIVWLKSATTDSAMLVQSLEKKFDVNNGLQYVIKGYSTMGYLRLRILWGIYNAKGIPTDIARDMVTTSIIAPDNPNRIIPYIVLDPDQIAYGDSRSFQRSYKQLDKAVEDILGPEDLGWRLKFNPFTKTHTFSIFQCADRSVGNADGNAPVVFSYDTEDFLSSEYFYNDADYRNVAFIAGAGEGAERKTTILYDAVGFDRSELYVDARDLAETDEDMNPIPEDEYVELMEQRGEQKLAENPVVQTFNASLRTVGAAYQLNRDYRIGDWVTVQDETLSITLRCKITTTNEVYDERGYTLDVTFGYEQHTLNEQINSILFN